MGHPSLTIGPLSGNAVKQFSLRASRRTWHCIGVFSDAVFARCHEVAEEHCVTGDGHAVPHFFSICPCFLDENYFTALPFRVNTNYWDVTQGRSRSEWALLHNTFGVRRADLPNPGILRNLGAEIP